MKHGDFPHHFLSMLTLPMQNHGAHDVLSGIRPGRGGFAVGSGAADRGNHGAIQGALGAGGTRLALDPRSTGAAVKFYLMWGKTTIPR